VRQAWTFFGLHGGFDRIWASLRWPMAVLAMTSMLAFVYFYLPNVRQRRRSIVPGSIVAVLGCLLASFGFRIYVTHFGKYARTYGALGTVVVLLLWLYLWGLMIIVGGQVNATLDRLRRHIVHTVKVPAPPRSKGALVLVDP
jgi:membrane protein